jgi:parallel beta-helix repeat protein
MGEKLFLQKKLVVLTPIFLLLVYYSSVTSAVQSCQLPNDGNMEGGMLLNAGCTYNQAIVIRKSHVDLDCNGAIIDGQNKIKVGIFIKGKSLRDITVRNCTIKNFNGAGVMIASGVRLKQDGDRDEYYRVAPKSIILDKLLVENNGRVGVYFNAYVAESVLSNSVVRNSKGVGVYLSQGSSNNKLDSNVIEGNGASGKRSSLREGVAIDSSARNLIQGNTFIDNAAGGIFLYKNCGEKFSTGRSVLRWQSSDENLIKNNKFVGGRIGVWVASRQSRDLSGWDCGDAPVDDKGKYFEDFSNKNKISGNRFCDVNVAVRVEGDHNIVSNNQFNEGVNRFVEEPYKLRDKPDGRRTVGNHVSGSVKQECDDI